MLASALRIEAGIVSASTGCGSKPPAVSTVLHSCGSYAFDIKSGGVVYEVGADAQTGKVLENKKEGRHPD